MASHAARDRLRAFIETEATSLRGTLRLYVLRAGLAYGEAVDPAVDDLLSEVVVEALAHAERFRPTGQPQAWLLGIAANLIRRRQVDLARRQRREPLVTDLAGSAGEADGPLSEDELFDRLASLTTAGPEDDLAARQATEALLDLVSDDDRRVLELAVLHELNGAMLARTLNITPGAGRVRLHRALNRLRRALAQAHTSDHTLAASVEAAPDKEGGDHV